MKKIILTTVLLLMWSAVSAQAMTGFEFLSVQNSLEKKRVIEPITISFVGQGYKNVPNWAALSSAIEELIRKNGYATKDIQAIALEAAITKGMTR